MSFCEELKANNIEPEKFIAMQNEFIATCRKQQELSKSTLDYREILERDQLLTMMEKFVNRLEREQLQEKINSMNSSTCL